MPTTPFDRPRFVGRSFAVVIGIVFTPIGAGAGYIVGLRGLFLLPAALLGGVLAGGVVYLFSTGFAEASGAGFLAFVQPSGRSTPYASQYSQGLALEAQGDLAGAMAWFEAELAARPDDPRLLVAVADLQLRSGAHANAEELYLRARRGSAQEAVELYCTQRLIDLRLGPLASPGRALPELRRVIDRFPGTREAEGARVALARLKSEGVAGSSP